MPMLPHHELHARWLLCHGCFGVKTRPRRPAQAVRALKATRRITEENRSFQEEVCL